MGKRATRTKPAEVERPNKPWAGYDLRKIPLMPAPPKKYQWYNPERHSVVCPLSLYHGWDDIRMRLWQIEQLGGIVVGEIEMPLDLELRYYLVKLPDTLTFEEDEESPEVFDFLDSKEHHRLRVIRGQIMQGTNVWTRYHPSDYHVKSLDLKPCVYDIADTEDDEQGKLIWVGKKEDGTIWDLIDVAKRWLDENKPGWEDPSKYWDEK